VDRVMAIAGSRATAPQWPRAAYLEAVAGRVALVAIEAGAVMGFAVAQVVLPEAELESIAVEAGSQGRGVGALLLRALMERLRGLGVSELGLEVRASNAAALGLYGRVGFREVGRRRAYYSGPVEDAVLLRVAL